jgi:uncharacterized protein (TIGR02598 family)
MKNAPFTHAGSTRGFSLIEVVLALAVVAVGLVTIIGLFPQGLNSARRAMDDSLSAMVAQDVLAARRVSIQDGKAAIGIVAATDSPLWYDATGTNLESAASSINAMYKCEIRATKINSQLEQTEVDIYWPWYSAILANKNPPPPNTNTFVTMIAKY